MRGTIEGPSSREVAALLKYRTQILCIPLDDSMGLAPTGTTIRPVVAVSQMVVGTEILLSFQYWLFVYIYVYSTRTRRP
ncbi:hypothetical protein LENED_001593 [Lentinula edodes]|uniref:Uncharacterized protein n=1 Tax=Lentinula edodes TaxID=5353 RepID=A0A1Q3DYU0_LENED|nr:hypothetical protein LENED_001593 [Lentinula edodes]